MAGLKNGACHGNLAFDLAFSPEFVEQCFLSVRVDVTHQMVMENFLEVLALASKCQQAHVFACSASVELQSIALRAISPPPIRASHRSVQDQAELLVKNGSMVFLFDSTSTILVSF